MQIKPRSSILQNYFPFGENEDCKLLKREGSIFKTGELKAEIQAHDQKIKSFQMENGLDKTTDSA